MSIGIPAQAQINDLFGRSLLISLLAHVLMFSLLVGISHWRSPQTGVLIAAAGEGTTGGAIAVGVVSASDIPALAAPDATLEAHTQPRHQSSVPSAGKEDITFEKPPRSPRSQPTDKPVAPGPRLFSPPRGGTTSSAPSGSLTAPFGAQAGVGLGEGVGSGGIPGGSDYGRRLQQALVSYYRYTPSHPGDSRFVVVRVRFDRTGKVLSIVNGRLDPLAFIVRSGNPVIDARVEAALLELNRNPIPFPGDFLPGVREAVAEIYFQY